MPPGPKLLIALAFILAGLAALRMRPIQRWWWGPTCAAGAVTFARHPLMVACPEVAPAIEAAATVARWALIPLALGAGAWFGALASRVRLQLAWRPALGSLVVALALGAWAARTLHPDGPADPFAAVMYPAIGLLLVVVGWPRRRYA